MSNNDKMLFSNALFDGMSNKIEMDLINSKTIPTYSKKSKMRVKRRIEKSIFDNNESRIIHIPLKKIIAIIVAAILLLTGCVSVIIYRKEFKNFFLEIYQDHVSILFKGDNELNVSTNKIETVYSLSYVPSDFSLTGRSENWNEVISLYENAENRMIKLTQCLIGSQNVGFGNDNLDGDPIKYINGLEIYHYQTGSDSSYSWSDERYSFVLYTNADLDEEEIAKIIEGTVERP